VHKTKIAVLKEREAGVMVSVGTGFIQEWVAATD
jgi:hypothetical protein